LPEQLSKQHPDWGLQMAPGSTHWSPPQKPFVQVPSQHSVAVVQAEPVPVHGVPPQTPATQSEPQQSADEAQAWPSGAQTGVGAQRPSVAQARPPQQVTPAALQEVPTGEQRSPG
jgi:hypothetical protein